MRSRGRSILRHAVAPVAGMALGVSAIAAGASSTTGHETTIQRSTDAPTTTTATSATAPPAAVAPTEASTTTAPATTTTTTAAPAPATTRPAPLPPPPARGDGEILLVWTSGGLPAGFADDVTGLPQVRSSTVVSGDLLKLIATTDASGNVVDRPGGDWAFPVDAFAVDPSSYASFAREPARAAISKLAPGGALLTESSAAVRRLGLGGTLELAGGPVTVTGIVPDADGAGAEVIVHRDDAGRLGIDDQRFILLTDSDRAEVERRIREITPSGAHLSLRSSAVASWLRHGDRVQPQVLVKLEFGEFSFRDRSGRDVELDPAWRAANIATESVPILGQITCHRRIIPLVRDAMTELEQSGKAHTVQPENYAGCYAPRRMAPGAGLSRHSWGLALDLNISSNPRGTYESQDPALVNAFRTRGFDWGGEWEFPDPGHYEYRAGA